MVGEQLPSPFPHPPPPPPPCAGNHRQLPSHTDGQAPSFAFLHHAPPPGFSGPANVLEGAIPQRCGSDAAFFNTKKKIDINKCPPSSVIWKRLFWGGATLNYCPLRPPALESLRVARLMQVSSPQTQSQALLFDAFPAPAFPRGWLYLLFGLSVSICTLYPTSTSKPHLLLSCEQNVIIICMHYGVDCSPCFAGDVA